MAETLLTLVIIGVVAALTIPGLNKNIQNRAAKSALKKTYSSLNQAVYRASLDLGMDPQCAYWMKNPYGSAHCTTYNSNGDCSKYELSNGSDLPPDYNGNFKHCSMMIPAMVKNLNVVKACESGAYARGCIPAYKGMDDIKKESNPSIKTDYDANKATAGCGGWRASSIKNTRAYVLSDGVIIFFYSASTPQIIAIDTNGKKGPNKWGYDIFTVILKGNRGDLPQYYAGGCEFVEKGGTYTINALNGK